jgi:hypothetical protein
MMAILNDFSSLPFLHEPPNPDAFVFTFVMMLGVCICDVGFSNTRQWLMALEHVEAMGLAPAEAPVPNKTSQNVANANEEFCGFGQPYAWSTQDTMESSPLSNPIQTPNKKFSNQELEDQFFVDGIFFGVPKKPVASTTEEGSSSASN